MGGSLLKKSNSLLPRSLSDIVPPEDDPTFPNMFIRRSVIVLKPNYGEELGNVCLRILLKHFPRTFDVLLVPYSPDSEIAELFVDGLEILPAPRPWVSRAES